MREPIKAAAACTRCGSPMTSKCPKCGRREGITYRNARAVDIRVGPHEVTAFVYDVRNTPYTRLPTLSTGYAPRIGNAADRSAVDHRIDGSKIIALDNPKRKPLPLHAGQRTAIGLYASTAEATAPLFVRWTCKCGGAGMMAAKVWNMKAQAVEYRGHGCEFCQVGPIKLPKREPVRAMGKAART